MPELRGKLKLLTKSQIAKLEVLADEFIHINSVLDAKEKLIRLAQTQLVLPKKTNREVGILYVKPNSEEADYKARILAANNWTAEELEAKLEKAREAQKS